MRYYIAALRRNYRFRRGVDALRAFHILRAAGHFAFCASEWRLVRDNAQLRRFLDEAVDFVLGGCDAD